MHSTVGISLLPAQAVAEGQGGGGCQRLWQGQAEGYLRTGDDRRNEGRDWYSIFKQCCLRLHRLNFG